MSKGILSIKIEPATPDQVGLIQLIAKRYSKELGFVMLAALHKSVLRGELLIARVNGQAPLGFVNFHRRRDGWHTIYEIAVAPTLLGKGVGRALFNAVPFPIRLKCTTDNERANRFYRSMGMSLVDTEEGRKRKLHVWELV